MRIKNGTVGAAAFFRQSQSESLVLMRAGFNKRLTVYKMQIIFKQNIEGKVQGSK